MPRLRRSCRKELQRNYVYRYGQTIGRLQRQLFCLFALLQVISLALNMTVFFICLCEGSEATKQSPGRVVVYGVYAAYFFEGIATLTLAMTRKKEYNACRWPLE